MLKRLLCVGLGILLMSNYSVTAEAANFPMGNIGIAAITHEVLDASEYIEYLEKNIGESWGYKELGIAVVEDNLNIREEADAASKVVGKMYNYAACEILGVENGWYHITSGEVEGYVSTDYIVTGIEAKMLGLDIAYKKAVVVSSGLYVHAEADELSEVVTEVAQNEELEVIDIVDGWVKCKLNTDEVYLDSRYVEVTESLGTAITITQFKYGMDVSDVRVDLCEYALQFVGNPYVWGGTSLTKGADCSGYVMRIFENYNIELPHYSRSQANYGTSISYKDAQPGDLLFYGNSRNSISHVAIYIGDGQIVHANDERTGIIVSNAYYRTPVAAVDLLGE